MIDLDLPHQVYCHIAGIDLIRDGDGRYLVLEDNLRTPSGVSYMLENRRMMMRLFPELLRGTVLPVEHYPAAVRIPCAHQRAARADRGGIDSTPQQRHFEHAFLAADGRGTVEGADLFVREGHLYMRTTAGRQRVDVVYRRVDDAYRSAARPDSLLGVPGCCRYRAGNVALSNAMGTGVADDKSTYPHAPDMIRFYSARSRFSATPTWQCKRPGEPSWCSTGCRAGVKEVQARAATAC